MGVSSRRLYRAAIFWRFNNLTILTLKMKDDELALVKVARDLVSRQFVVSRHRLMKEAMRIGLLQIIQDKKLMHGENQAV